MYDQLVEARARFTRRVKSEVIFERNDKSGDYASVADSGSVASRAIANSWAAKLDGSFGVAIVEQKSGAQFEVAVKDYLAEAFEIMARGGIELANGYRVTRGGTISHSSQYSHLEQIEHLLHQSPELETVFGRDYGVKPDIMVHRPRNVPSDIGAPAVDQRAMMRYSPYLADAIHVTPNANILAAIVSCKLSIRPDRVQNTRLEASSAIRARKGRTPHIVVITAEPSPNRLASITFGTGDIDMVYHAALYELEQAALEFNDAAHGMLKRMVAGNRIRDISDLPLDLML